MRLPILIALALAGPVAQAAERACEDLRFLHLPDTVITVTERIDSGTFTPPGSDNAISVPAICRVHGTVSPAINFEVWMPASGDWNGRLQAVGGGGLAGVISYAAMATAVRDGYASASTDTGHVASDLTWLGDRQRMIDYGHRAIHEMTVKSKAIIAARYGTPAEFAYFNGCSTGGRQGLMEAQRYPEDYDGIVSGAPVNTFTRLHIAQLWTAHATLKEEGAVLDAAAFSLLTDAVMAQCDALDGVSDGILTDPRMCEFDPTELQCAAGETAACLAPGQVSAAQMIYAGPSNPRTGVPIYPGLEPGGEAAQPGNPGWALLMNGETPFFYDIAVIGGAAFENLDYDWTQFDFDSDLEFVQAKLAGVLEAVNPDLRDFAANGGKLIIYHGWNDPGVMPQRTVDFYGEIVDFANKVTSGQGAESTAGFARLFMQPGVGHCRGGPGPDQADFMAALSAWVEAGDAPERIEGWREAGGEIVLTRPLCPHPQVARYRGRGDTTDSASFECAVP